MAEYHYSHGGIHLLIDEIHYQHDWQQLLKNLYDDFPELSVVYTGSSLLKLETSGATSRGAFESNANMLTPVG